MTRIVKTRVETEGKVHEEYAVVEDESLEAWDDAKTAGMRYVGKPTPRIEGIERVTGRAHYTHDIQLPGMLHAVLVRSRLAHARVTHIDTSAAEALPGVVAILTPQTMPPLEGVTPLAEEPEYVGRAIAAVCAESDAIARDAADLIKVTYEPLPFVTDMQKAQTDAERLQKGNVVERGDIEAGFAEADVIVEGTFHTPAAVHHCLETHGSVVQWEGDRLTIWTSTQGPFSVRREVATALGLPLTRVRVIKQYMGGGFGSKFGPGDYTFVAAAFAKQTAAPVRCVLNRHEEAIASGHRHETIQHYKIGAKKDGTLTAMSLEATGNMGAGGFTFGLPLPLLNLYRCPNVRTLEEGVKTNLGSNEAFRAPGVVEATFAFESIIDDVAKAIGMDPLEFRRKNYAEVDQSRNLPYSTKTLREMYDKGAEAIGWGQTSAASESPTKKRGKGMASQIWGGGGGPPAYATLRIDSDGKAIIYCGAADLGTGTRTALALIAAEELGFRLQDIVVELGDTLTTPYAPGAGGSMTIASIGSAARGAASDARSQLIEIAASFFEAPVDVIEIAESEIRNRERPDFRMSVAEFMGKLGDVEITGKGSRGPNDDKHAVQTFGAQFAEVEVDMETGEVTVLKLVAVHDSGRIVNPLTAGSQIEGGVIQGLGFGLTERRIVDEPTGHVVNDNLESYKLPTADIPPIEYHFIQVPDTIANSVGAKGVGEPPIIPTAGAIANAVANAIGTRIYALPLSREAILDALAKQAPQTVKPGGNFKPMTRVRQ